MEPQNCYICNAMSVFYTRNLFKTKSKYSETRLCEFIRKFLGNYPSERELASVEGGDDENCVCMECLNKIDEYDLASITAKRVEIELRDLLLHTEASFYRDSKAITTEGLFVTPIESINTLDELKVEECDSNEEIDSFEQMSDIEVDEAELDSGDKYIPTGSQRRLDHLVAESGRKPSLREERRNHKCSLCNMEFKSGAALARHKHTKSESCNNFDLKSITYNCTTCSEMFCTKVQYESHLKQHKEEGEQFKCSICGFDLKEKSALDDHVTLHADLSPLQCVICKKSLKQKGALVRHMRIHSGLHFYQCHRCGKGFVHRSSFEMHLMAHDDIRKKKCPHCSQMFRSTSHLNRHLRIHTGSKPFSCPVCGQKFAQRYNMSVHLRLHDTSSNRPKPEKSHTCKFCNSSFARQSKLEEHLKKNHEAAIPHSSIGNQLDDTNLV